MTARSAVDAPDARGGTDADPDGADVNDGSTSGTSPDATPGGETRVEPSSWRRERAGRTRGAALGGTLAVGVGALTGTPSALLVAVPIVGFLLYDRLTTLDVPEVEISREVGRNRPLPGRKVTVTVQVRNTGESNIADLRVVDGVPDSLAVVDGSPRAGLSVPAGETATFEYAVRARRGAHEFSETTLLARNLSGSVRARASVGVPSVLDSRVRGETYGLAGRPSTMSGALDTSRGGAGVEFHSLREYDTSDPANRIDWRRLAAGGDLATIRFRESNAAYVHIVVDRRPSTAVTFEPTTLTHRENATYAAEMLSEMLADDRHHVGVSAYGGDRDPVFPAAGEEHRLRLRRLFDRLGDADEAVRAKAETTGRGGSKGNREPTDDDGPAPTAVADDLVARLPTRAQYILVSPLFDDAFVDLARRLRAHDRGVTVVTPRPTGGTAKGQRLAMVGRELRLGGLKRRGVAVFDWDTDEPLPLALEYRFGVSR